ncbi:MAG TPA: selenoneine synthase SenA [Casimicrobiaceae bacterium]
MTTSSTDDGLAARTLDGDALDRALVDAHERTWALLADLAPSQWTVPYNPGINPPLWECSHVAWFTEWWVLREGYWNENGDLVTKRPSLLPGADRWFDSGRVPHVDRWTLDLPPQAALREYAATVLDNVRAKLRARNGEGPYPFRLALLHADMHGEALTYMRQTLDYSTPALGDLPTRLARLTPPENANNAVIVDDAVMASGAFTQGSSDDGAFVFDNEKWAHEVALGPTRIARRCVTNAEYVAFVDAGGYADRRLWSDAGWAWRGERELAHPQRWRRRRDGGWEERWFGAWRLLAEARPACHVSAHEAEAYCRFAQRRLPREAEWERAAVDDAIEWGHAVWEWTADAFLPYPGFSPDRYRDYSQPWFATHRSVRGGSFATVARIHHPRYRNFYVPGRNDIFVGFRTCALDGR